MVSNDVTIAIHPILFYCKECIPIKRSYNVDVIISGKLCNTSLLYRSSLVKKRRYVQVIQYSINMLLFYKSTIPIILIPKSLVLQRKIS